MKKISLCLILLVIFPLSINALEEVDISCPGNILRGETMECVVTGNSDYEVSAVEIRLTYPKGVEFVEFITDPIWEGNSTKDTILLYTANNKINKFNIGKIKFKSEIDTSMEININYSMFADSNFNEHIFIGEEENVNLTDTKQEETTIKKHNYFMYGIILLIVGIIGGCLVVIFRKFIKNRSGKNEK